MRLEFEHRGEPIVLDATQHGDGWRVRLPDNSERTIRASRTGDDALRIAEGDRVFTVPFVRVDGAVHFSFGGRVYVFEPAAIARTTKARSHGSGTLTAPMVGLVTSVLVKEGQPVNAFEPLVVIEAMKVLATLEAPYAGTVRKLHVKHGDQVAHGAPVVEVSPLEVGN